MIAVKIGDGMGNQLFNYACGYAQARRDGDSLVLDISECDNSTLRDFELDKFHLKYDKKESFPNRNLGQKIYKNLRRALKYHVIKEREVYHNRDHRYDVNDIDPRVYKKKGLRNKYLYGYWQHLAYFEDYLDEITAMMTPAYEQSETVKKLQEEFKKTPTCAVHVRGGDIMGPAGAYFKHAMERMEQEKPGVRYIVFTNDMERAEEALAPVLESQKKDAVGQAENRLEFVSEMGEFSDVDEFFLMAACQNSGVSLLGVSVLSPFITAVMNPEELLKNDIIRSVYDGFHMQNTNQLITLLSVLIIIVYIAKNAFIIFINNMLYCFSYYGKREMQDRMMKYYISRDYTFFLNHNSAELMRDINTDPEMFYAAVLNMLQLASELCVSLILVGYLLVKDALLTLGVAFAMVVMVFIFMKKLRRTLARFGDDRRKYNANILQCMQQAFGGIKEIKIANREAYFEGEFVKQNGLYTYVIKQNSFLSSIPKPIMEALCITGLMAAIIVRINATSTSPEQFVGTLAVFAAAAFALLPSANKMSEYLGSIIHNGVVIHKIGEEYAAIRDMEIQTEKEENYKKVTLDKEIKVEDMTFHYPDTEDAVLAHVNVTIPKNKSVAFIGPSGAGKTTMVDLILGVLKPQAGKITVDGMDIKESYRGWHDKIGYIPQTIYMLDDTIRNNIAFGKTEGIDDADIWEALKQAQLDEFVKSLDEGLDTMIGEAGVRLSGGQRQRIGIARALYRRPEVLVLDEATSALDTETEAAVMEAIDSLQGKMTMLIIAHRLSTIKNCDMVYQVEGGSVTRKEKESV